MIPVSVFPPTLPSIISFWDLPLFTRKTATTKVTTATTITSNRNTTTPATTPVLSAGAKETLEGIVVIESFPVLVVGEFVSGTSFERVVSVSGVAMGGSVEEGGVVPIVVGLVGGSVVGRGAVKHNGNYV